MKATLFIAVAAITLCSCSKVYKCECKDNTGNIATTFEVAGKTKNDSRNHCVAYGNTVNASQNKGYECKLK